MSGNKIIHINQYKKKYTYKNIIIIISCFLIMVNGYLIYSVLKS